MIKCLCLLLGHVNTILEPSGSSSSIIPLHYVITFNNTLYLCSQTQFECVHKYNFIHTSMLQKINPKLAKIWPCHQFSNCPWPSSNIGQSMLSMLGFNVALEVRLLKVRSKRSPTLYTHWEGLTTPGPNLLNCDCWMRLQRRVKMEETFDRLQGGNRLLGWSQPKSSTLSNVAQHSNRAINFY